MTRLYGRAAKHRRVIEAVPDVRVAFRMIMIFPPNWSNEQIRMLIIP
jgi:hypothetical protein